MPNLEQGIVTPSSNIVPDPSEIVSLSMESLDIEELEHRLELAMAEVSAASWLCVLDCEGPCFPGPEEDIPV